MDTCRNRKNPIATSRSECAYGSIACVKVGLVVVTELLRSAHIFLINFNEIMNDRSATLERLRNTGSVCFRPTSHPQPHLRRFVEACSRYTCAIRPVHGTFSATSPKVLNTRSEAR